MCGIIGYVGARQATPLLVRGIARLEYRGYDSTGVAVTHRGHLDVRKVAGRLDRLRELLVVAPVDGTCGIGHTRWATHGAPSDANAHPHVDCTRRVAVVHNGVIENADVLRQQLVADGHRFATETDTEVLAHLIESARGDALEERVAAALTVVRGTYGLIVVDVDEPDVLVAARRGSPVLIGIGQDEYFVASDVSAVIEHTRSIAYLDDGDIARVSRAGYEVVDRDEQTQERHIATVDWSPDALERGGFAHFMLKEIFEQPATIANVLRGRTIASDGSVRLDGLNLDEADLATVSRIRLLGCGSSWHAGLVARHYLEHLTGLPTEVEYASEFRYRQPLDAAGTLTVAISQSGETADTLEALHVARAAGSPVIGIVNVVGSSIARASHGGIYLHAGPEIGVASTKSFTAQLIALLLLALHIGAKRSLPRETRQRIIGQLEQLPELVAESLDLEPQLRDVAKEFDGAGSALYLGRGLQFPVALEGALKLKEISYIHAEGYPAAEMKHGPLALVDPNTPVVFLAPKDPLYAKTITNMHEVRARGGRIVAFTSEGNGDLSGLATHQVRIPSCDPLLAPVVSVVPLQLLAYHVALQRGADVDRPRHLAKSVTVE